LPPDRYVIVVFLPDSFHFSSRRPPRQQLNKTVHTCTIRFFNAYYTKITLFCGALRKYAKLLLNVLPYFDHSLRRRIQQKLESVFGCRRGEFMNQGALRAGRAGTPRTPHHKSASTNQKLDHGTIP
jgi:hypothetical protein